jgi:hypothetical protein
VLEGSIAQSAQCAWIRAMVIGVDVGAGAGGHDQGE